MIEMGYSTTSGYWVKSRYGMKFRWSEYLDGATDLQVEVEIHIGKNLN